MPEQEYRRLAAILILDVVGYSRAMAEDEAGALHRTLHAQQEVLEPAIARNGGRIVKRMGDGILAEFGSVTEAVGCALEMQAGMGKAAGQEDGAAPQQVRIGINLGEVIVEGEDIYGNGVNVTARIEALAGPGGIAITSTAREHLRRELRARFVDGGPVQVKNIPEPVRVYHLRDGNALATAAPVKTVVRERRRVALAATAACAVIALALWAGFSNLNLGGWAPADIMAPGLPLDRPSIVVLPFDNLSNDPEQRYFSDGITDNLITDLSQIGGLLVIARNTSFSFRERGEVLGSRAIGQMLGVRYVVEGSIQLSGERVRINASLTDTRTGLQVWANRLDRELTELFNLQDEVANQIVNALEVELTQQQRRQIAKRYTDSLEAYDLYLRAWEEVWIANQQGLRMAREYLREALRIDPEFALAKGLLATSYTNRAGTFIQNDQHMLDTARRLAREAAALDPDLPAVQASLGLVHLFSREFEAARDAFARALELDPNYADAYALQAWNQHYYGNPKDALSGFEYAFSLNPRPPFPYLNAMSEIHFALGDYEKALDWGQRAIERNPDALRQRLFLAATYAMLDRIADAEWEIEEARLLQPDLSLSQISAIAPYRIPAMANRLFEALRRAGLSD